MVAIAEEWSSKKVYYHGGEIEVLLGDVVQTRVFFRKTEGRIAYVPGQSPKHPEMEIEGLTFVGIRTKDQGMIGVTVIPETNTIKKKIKFISRDPDGKFEKVGRDEALFEDEDGMPL